MPTRPPTPCRHPMCGSLVYQGGGYCAEHKAQHVTSSRQQHEANRMADPARAYAKTTRSTSRWTKTSRLFRATYPTCCDPFSQHGEFPPLTDHVHHVTGMQAIYHSGDHEKAFDWSNLRPLCEACHKRVEGMENRGESTASLFPAMPMADIGVGFA